MRKAIKLLAMVLIFAMLLPTAAAMAADQEDTSLATPQDEKSIINSAELQQWLEQYMEENNITSSQISVGYCYTGTGDSWYYNGDKWFYPASMYKVPLIMLLSEKVKAGELSQDSMIYDKDVATIEEYILTYSNNDWAHTIRTYLGGDSQWRKDAQKYAQLDEDDYDSDYLDYCYFSNRYMTQVMTTLYNNSEDFPNVVNCLLDAEPNAYFKLHQTVVTEASDDDSEDNEEAEEAAQELSTGYAIAQKYGSYEDSRGEKFNHCTAIIYTPNPCIVTVMTSNVTKYERVIADIGDKLIEYTLSLDSQLDSHQQKLEEMAAEEERLAQEAAEEAQRQAEEEAQRRAEEQEQLQAQAEKEASAAKRQAVLDKVLSIVKIVAIVVVVLLVLRFGFRVYRQVRIKEAEQNARARRRSSQNVDDFEDDDEYNEPVQPVRRRTSVPVESFDEDEETYQQDEDEQEDNEEEPVYQPRKRQTSYESFDRPLDEEDYQPAPQRRSRSSFGGRSNKYTPKH